MEYLILTPIIAILALGIGWMIFELCRPQNKKTPLDILFDEFAKEKYEAVEPEPVKHPAMTAPIKRDDKVTLERVEGLGWMNTQEPKIPRGYTRHNGGECPIKTRRTVSIIHRDGVKNIITTIDKKTLWVHDGACPYDEIVAYKIIKPSSKKK